MAANPTPTKSGSTGLFESYQTDNFYDEMFAAPGVPRPHYAKLFNTLADISPEHYDARRKLADLAFLLQGITFTVYSDGAGTERLFPFDLIPRIVPHSEWEVVERGLQQRVRALNLFLQDIYGSQKILNNAKIPRDLIYSCKQFRREMIGLKVPKGIFAHISGIDLIRDSKTGEYLVLEDNVRTPSGVSYVLENRQVMTRAFAEAASIEGIPDVARRGLTDLAELFRQARARLETSGTLRGVAEGLVERLDLRGALDDTAEGGRQGVQRYQNVLALLAWLDAHARRE